MQRILDYSTEFSSLLETFDWPVALLPPAVYQMLRLSVAPDEIETAVASLGFREVRAVASGLDPLASSLEAEAEKHTDGPLLFSACPEVLKIARSEYPETAKRFASSKPPADIVAEAARKAQPEATLFFLSPCSSRAKALLARERSPGVPLVDYTVRLFSIFPALLAAIEDATGACPEVAGLQPSDGHMGGTRGRTEFVPTETAIRAWLGDFSAADNSGSAGSCIELMICPGGCAQGDWSPLRVSVGCADEECAKKKTVCAKY